MGPWSKYLYAQRFSTLPNFTMFCGRALKESLRQLSNGLGRKLLRYDFEGTVIYIDFAVTTAELRRLYGSGAAVVVLAARRTRLQCGQNREG